MKLITTITASQLVARDKKYFFLVEDNHETIKELYGTIVDLRKKLKSLARKRNGIVLEATDKKSDFNRKIPKINLYNLPDFKRRKKPWAGRVELV